MTKTAEQLADDYNPTTRTVVLYQTRGGAFFLHEQEGWHIKEDGEWVSKISDSFVPMTYEQTQKWVLSGDVEIIGDVFPDPPEASAEDKPGATIYVRVPQSLKERIDGAAAKVDLSINAWAMRCLETCLSAKTEQEELDRLEAQLPSE